MSSPYILLRSSARWLLSILVLGLLIRSAFVWQYALGPFTWGNLIHAHSHTAYFGWGGLGLMGLILHVLPFLTGRPLDGGPHLAWLLRLSPWAVGGALATFAYFGYKGPSLGFAVLNEVLWVLFAGLFWRNVRAKPVAQWPAALWLIGVAVVMLLLSIGGTALVILTRVVLPFVSPALSNSGVYLFLQAYGDGWLEIGLMGVVAALMGDLADRWLAKLQAWLMLVLMVPASLRLLAPFGLEGPLFELGAVAGAGLAVAQALFLVNAAASRLAIPAAARPWWMLAAGALGLKAVLELLPLAPGWTALAGERQLVIAFLHLKLLGIVTAGQIGALAALGRGGRGFGLFAGGAAIMIAALAAHGFLAASVGPLGPVLYDVAMAGGAVAATGAALAVWPWARGS